MRSLSCSIRASNRTSPHALWVRTDAAKAPFPYHCANINSAARALPRVLPANKGHPSALGPVGIGGASGIRPAPPGAGRPPSEARATQGRMSGVERCLGRVTLERDRRVVFDRALAGLGRL